MAVGETGNKQLKHWLEVHPANHDRDEDRYTCKTAPGTTERYQLELLDQRADDAQLRV